MLTIHGCMTPNPNEAKAKRILKEIGEIAGKPVGGQGKQEIMEAMNRLNHEKEAFPDGRDQIIADARLGKQFFVRY